MPRILVVDDNKLSLRMIERRLTSSGFQVMTAETGLAALESVKSGNARPDLIISDVMMPGLNGYDLCRELRKTPATAQTPIILLTSKGGVQEKVAGFQAGADDYLVKPVEPAELEVRIRALLSRVKATKARETGTRSSGKVISVFSLRGGAGVSCLAANLAVALAQLWRTECTFVDLALSSGYALMMFDLTSKYTLVNLAEYQQSNELDEQVINGCLTKHESGVQILAGLRKPEFVDLVPSSLIPTVLPFLQERSDYIVIDTSSSFSEHNLEVFDASDLIILVVNPEMASMQASTSALDVFASLDYPNDKIAVVLNWTFPRMGLPQKSIETALRTPIRAVIPYEETLFVRAINTGLPAVWEHPNAPASLAIQELAYKLSLPQHTNRQPENPTETWVRIQSYMQKKRK